MQPRVGDENAHIAGELREAAALLEAQGANPFRVAAFRHAAEVVARSPQPLREAFDARGRAALQALPGVGAGISSAIAEMLVTGKWEQLARLRGHADPHADERPLDRSHDPRRRAQLPPVETVLDVDREYREKAAAGRLALIAPKRFNPEGRAWLPVLHTRRGSWHFTALFSNTARAHELGRTHDWVVIYFYDGDHHEQQCTVVTPAWGPLAGRRVVRGREHELQEAHAGALGAL